MKYLLYYNLDNKFKSDQIKAGGNGEKVVSVVDGLAWTRDAEKAYYRYAPNDSGEVTTYTLTVHYKSVDGETLAPDEMISVDVYNGKATKQYIIGKVLSGYSPIEEARTIMVSKNIDCDFLYLPEGMGLNEVPLTFSIKSGGTITWRKNLSYGPSSLVSGKKIKYSVNGGTWVEITSNADYSAPSINVEAGDVVRFEGDNSYYSGVFTYQQEEENYWNYFGGTSRFKIYGNIMSLLDSYNYPTKTVISNSAALECIFSGCTGLVDAHNLALPATTLASRCYNGMFKGCTSLTAAPELPATTLATDCYSGMFYSCTSLTTAPELPAKTLATYCYTSMFDRCTSLTTAPELPATTLAYGCYSGMFYSCTSLTTAPELPATALTISCYQNMFQGCTSLTTAPELPATALTQTCYYGMFSGCTSLTTAPELPATTLAYYCYCSMFRGCTSLTTAPVLPATTLAQSCYQNMFQGCTSLTTAPSILPATTLTGSCYASMFSGCTNLTTAPELPATTLAGYCYNGMFGSCTNLNYIKCLATDISASYCLNNWANGVQTTSGTFIKSPDITESTWGRGANGIPDNWTVQDAS